MPFQKLGKNKYQGPSGKTFTLAQVKLYYYLGGHFPGQVRNIKSQKQERKAKKKTNGK